MWVHTVVLLGSVSGYATVPISDSATPNKITDFFNFQASNLEVVSLRPWIAAGRGWSVHSGLGMNCRPMLRKIITSWTCSLAKGVWRGIYRWTGGASAMAQVLYWSVGVNRELSVKAMLIYPWLMLVCILSDCHKVIQEGLRVLVHFQALLVLWS